jgi:hypothetical protein
MLDVPLLPALLPPAPPAEARPAALLAEARDPRPSPAPQPAAPAS